jgi:hypothetical protein
MAARTRFTPVIAVAALFLVGLADPARAATTPPGVNLRWDHC